MLSGDKDERDDLEEEGYVKQDARASRAPSAEESERETPGPEAEPAAPESEPPPTQAADDVPDIDVYSLLRMSVGMYVEQAWIHMGLRVDPRKGKAEPNLPYAKVAIDTVAFVVEQLQPNLDENEKRELDIMLANLRMNYVQRT